MRDCHQSTRLDMEISILLLGIKQLQRTKKYEHNQVSRPRVDSTVLFALGISSQIVNGLCAACETATSRRASTWRYRYCYWALNNSNGRRNNKQFGLCELHHTVCEHAAAPFGFLDAQTYHDGASHASIHLWVTKCSEVCEEFAHTRCIHVPSPNPPSRTLRA